MTSSIDHQELLSRAAGYVLGALSPDERAEFAARYTAKYGAINNYAANSYDSARILIAAIERAATSRHGVPARADVVAAMRTGPFQGIAYARAVEWDAKGDNVAAVIFVNTVEDHRFKEIDQIAGR